MAKCRYNQMIFGQVVDCFVEDCGECRYNPDLSKSLRVIDEITKNELNQQEE